MTSIVTVTTSFTTSSIITTKRFCGEMRQTSTINVKPVLLLLSSKRRYIQQLERQFIVSTIQCQSDCVTTARTGSSVFHRTHQVSIPSSNTNFVKNVNGRVFDLTGNVKLFSSISSSSTCISVESEATATTTPSQTTTTTTTITSSSSLLSNNDDDEKEQEQSPTKINHTDTVLDFESNFDFSTNPRWDVRFDNDLNKHEAFIIKDHNNYNNKKNKNKNKKEEERQSSSSSSVVVVASGPALTDDEFVSIRDREAIEDEIAAKRLQQCHAAYSQLDPSIVKKATDLLRPYVLPERIQRIESILKQRTRHTRFLFENPINPSNVFACLRTLDAFGIQVVDIVVDKTQYNGRAAVSQKRGMRTATGSAQWLTINYHMTTAEAIQSIRHQHSIVNEDIVIYASDVNPSSQDIRTIQWTNQRNSDTTKIITDDSTSSSTSDKDPCICIVMGNEDRGISDEMKALVDYTFTLPMVGFAESFNLSVATAITLAHLSSQSTFDKSTTPATPNGPLRPGDIQHHQYDCLLLKGLINSVAQKRIIQPLLRKANIILPQEIIQSI